MERAVEEELDEGEMVGGMISVIPNLNLGVTSVLSKSGKEDEITSFRACGYSEVVERWRWSGGAAEEAGERAVEEGEAIGERAGAGAGAETGAGEGAGAGAEEGATKRGEIGGENLCERGEVGEEEEEGLVRREAL